MKHIKDNSNKIYQNLTPEEKLIQSLLLYSNAKELKKAFLKFRHPELSDDELENKVKEIFQNATN